MAAEQISTGMVAVSVVADTLVNIYEKTEKFIVKKKRLLFIVAFNRDRVLRLSNSYDILRLLHLFH